MSDVVISVEGLGKKYRIRHQGAPKYVALRDVVVDKFTARIRWIRDKRRSGNGSQSPGILPQISTPASREDFWALKDVSFEVKQGEVVGIIGRNGAGKSTLLKVLSRITEPTVGRVQLEGRVSSLLEVGTGFHPELTGRENIFLNGAILGMTRAEIKKKFDEIVAFAEVERFLDTPVKWYSSGMYVRLAFAVAAHLEPEILIVDEVLAVGDAEFQKKCLGKMQDVSRGGRTVLFVSHNMQTIQQMCNRAILMMRGQKMADGETSQVVQNYLQDTSAKAPMSEIASLISELPVDPAFRLRSIDVLQDGLSTTAALTGKPVQVRLTYDVLQDTLGLHVYVMFCDLDGTVIFESLHNGDSESAPFMSEGSYVSVVTIPADFLAGREYEIKIWAGIHRIRTLFPKPLCIRLDMHYGGKVNRAYAGYSSPGKIAPLLTWQTVKCS